MSRTNRTERTNPKPVSRKAPRPRMNEFTEQWYKDHGYTVTAPTEPQSSPLDDMLGELRGYVEADA